MNHSSRPVVVGFADKEVSALLVGLEEARSRGVTLRVVHSVGAEAGSVYAVQRALYESLEAEGHTVIDRARELLDGHADGVEIEYVLSKRPPVPALLDEAETAAVLVLGADDRHGLERLLGSRVAGYVALRAACPVVVVPDRDIDAVSGDVAVAIDGETSADGPLQFAFEQADARGATLHVVHARPAGLSLSEVDADQVAVSAVLAGWRERFPDVSVVETFDVGEPKSTLARTTIDTAMLVVGRPNDPDRLLGAARSVAAGVLKRAHGVVAVVPLTYPER